MIIPSFNDRLSAARAGICPLSFVFIMNEGKWLAFAEFDNSTLEETSSDGTKKSTLFRGNLYLGATQNVLRDASLTITTEDTMIVSAGHFCFIMHADGDNLSCKCGNAAVDVRFFMPQ